MRVNHNGSLFRLGMVGFLINTIQFMFQIPEAKLAKLKRSLESMILDGYATYRELARLAGFIISLSLAVGPIACFRVTSLFSKTKNYESFCSSSFIRCKTL